MDAIKPTFLVNLYDSDGDILDKGVFLCFGGTLIKVSDSLEGFPEFCDHLASINKEISETY